MPYQVAGARFLAGGERRALWDEPGVGKTAQAIRAMDGLGLRRGVIVCPASAREVWIGEFKKFARVPRRILKGEDIGDLALWISGKVDVLIISYHLALKWAKRMEGDLIEFLVLDEAHYCKSKDSQWTRELLGAHCDGDYGLGKWAAYVWFLTGSPAPNDPGDVWTTLRFCGATKLTYKIFTDRYYNKRVGAYSNSYTVRDEMLEELRRVLDSVSFRRTAKQVGLQLPPVFLTSVTVDGDTREIRELLRNYPGLEDAIVEAVEKGGLSFLDAQHIATLRRLTGEAKAPSFAELLAEECKDDHKRIVFGIHRRALSIISDHLKRSGIELVRFDGETSERDRERAKASFQGGNSQVFLANIRSAGTALTLTAASEVTMFETDWAPEPNYQAIKRAHRIGQTKRVRARFITLANSIDERVSGIVARKTGDLLKMGVLTDIAA